MSGMSGRFIVLSSKEIITSLLMICLITLLYLSGTSIVNKVIETVIQGKLLPIYSVETQDKKVALTFDCAWRADDIPSIINTLVQSNVSATFFCVGTWIDKYPESVKNLYEAGMTIGNHSNSHKHVNKMSYGENLEDMTNCNDKIESITGKKVKYYRGPYGEYNNTVISVANELNMNVIQWDIDTLDYEGKTAKEMCERIKKKIRNGSIILMHNDTKYTAVGLQQIIDTIKDEGYEIVSLDDLIYKDNYDINHEGRQIQISSKNV